jgi:hypothetical protein
MCCVFVLSSGGPPISIKETTQLEQVFQKLQRIRKGYRSKKGANRHRRVENATAIFPSSHTNKLFQG